MIHVQFINLEKTWKSFGEERFCSEAFNKNKNFRNDIIDLLVNNLFDASCSKEMKKTRASFYLSTLISVPESTSLFIV